MSISSSSYRLYAGETVQFRIDIKGLPPSVQLTYNWSVSSGRIIGQGPVISVQVNDVGSCTATVELEGLPRECTSTTSSTVDVIKAPQKILAVNYTNIAALNQMIKKFIVQTRLKDLKILQTALIKIYPGITTGSGELFAIHTAIVKAFRINGINTYRYKISDEGIKKVASFEMYIVMEENGKPVPGY